jgi:hypothetical protein
MKKVIPQAVIAVVADYVAAKETHASLDSLFMYAGCPEEVPEGSKHVKALAWLRATNTSPAVKDPLAVLGKVVEAYMDAEVSERDYYFETVSTFRKKVTATLAAASLRYRAGGIVTGSLAAPTQSLAGFIKNRDERAISEEFERAAQKAESEPREAVSAAANILESLCKHYIEAESLTMPSKQVLKELWNVVRKDLGFDPAQVADDDLKVVLVGLIQIVDGLGAFRTHASSAHGGGPKSYRLQPRHSRLAVHAAHTAALFILESWEHKKGKPAP